MDDPIPLRGPIQSPRYRPGPGKPKGHKKGATRQMRVQIDAELYFMVNQVALITKIPKWKIVEAGIKLKLGDLRKTWNLDEWLMSVKGPEGENLRKLANPEGTDVD